MENSKGYKIISFNIFFKTYHTSAHCYESCDKTLQQNSNFRIQRYTEPLNLIA